MRDLEQIAKDFVLEANGGDYVGLWQIVNAIGHEFGIADEAYVRTAALRIVEDLLGRGLEAVDLVAGGGCIPWGEKEPKQVICRIEREWDDLGREPNIGEICWFNLPKTSQRVQV